MINLTNPIFVILATSGIAIWLIGIYVLRRPPKSINRVYGYRTPRSMKSQEAWEFAQIYGTRKMIAGAQFMLLFGTAALFFRTTEMIGVGIAFLVLLLCLIVPLVLTEQELKKRFP